MLDNLKEVLDDIKTLMNEGNEFESPYCSQFDMSRVYREIAELKARRRPEELPLTERVIEWLREVGP